MTTKANDIPRDGWTMYPTNEFRPLTWWKHAKGRVEAATVHRAEGYVTRYIPYDTRNVRLDPGFHYLPDAQRKVEDSA